MATADYVLANQSGAAFRTDLNNTLAAIVSNNSNSSEPATKYAYQWWADTSNAVMKLRNSANDGWIELFQLDGTLTLENGSASAPALAFRDDLNTGLFSSANDHLNLVTAGVTRLGIGSSSLVINEGGADYDVRFEGDSNANLFYLDAGNDRIGIGTNSPSQRLSVSAGHVNLDVGYSYQWGDSHERISHADGEIQFFTNNTEKMVLDGSNLGIGQTSPSSAVDIISDGTNNLPLKFIRGGSSVAGHLYSDGGGSGIVGSDGTLANTGIYLVNNSRIDFRVGGGERVRIDADGIKFSGDTATANGLSDYEEGGWSGLLNGGNFTATQQYFRYTKVGRMVLISGELSSFSSNSNSSNIEMTGAPFATESNCSHIGAINTTKLNKYSGYTNPQAARIEEGTTRVVFMYGGENGNTRFAVRYGDLNATTAVIQFTIPYMTA